MTPKEIFDTLKNRFGENVLSLNEEVVTPYILFERAAVLEIMKMLRDDESLRFDFLNCLTCVDQIKDEKFEVVYHLTSTELGHRIALKTELPREDPRIRTVISVWNAANWHEREGWDLMGVTFEGHPQLVRLLTPEDWEGHPLRKDYKQAEFYHGIPTR